jgi:uncharacterized protein (TIGR00730 family)
VAAVAVFCGSSTGLEQRFLDLAAQAGTMLAGRGHTVVSGGGRVGMMGALAEAARAAGAHTLGVIPRALVDLEVADRAVDELVVTRDMAERKTVMMERADAFLVLPGGLGTMDELFEVWTTAVLGLHDKPVVLVDADGFYAGLMRWVGGLTDAGFAGERALRLLLVADSLPAALALVEQRLPTGG